MCRYEGNLPAACTHCTNQARYCGIVRVRVSLLVFVYRYMYVFVSRYSNTTAPSGSHAKARQARARAPARRRTNGWLAALWRTSRCSPLHRLSPSPDRKCDRQLRRRAWVLALQRRQRSPGVDPRMRTGTATSITKCPVAQREDTRAWLPFGQMPLQIGDSRLVQQTAMHDGYWGSDNT